jgi:hypothetical protein
MTSKIDKLESQIKQLNHYTDTDGWKFVVDHMAFWTNGNDSSRGVYLDTNSDHVNIWRVDVTTGEFDIWHDGQFVDISGHCFDAYLSWVEGAVDTLLLG